MLRFSLFAVFLLLALPLFAMPNAGSVIENQAIATYLDERGVVKTMLSNSVTVIVAKVCAATLDFPRTLEATPGQTLWLVQQLTHQGNSESRYNLTLSNLQGELVSSRIWLDSNANGLQDAGDLLLMNQPLLMKPNAPVSLLIEVVVPPSGLTQENTLAVTANCDGSPVAENLHRFTPSQAAGKLQINKSVVPTGAVPAGSTLRYTLNLTSPGANDLPTRITVNGQDRQALLVRDPIPANTIFLESQNSANLPLLYQTAGDPLLHFRTTPPADRRAITAVALALEEASDRLQWQISVEVAANASGVAMPPVTNTATVYKGGSTPELQSNRVETPIIAADNAAPATIEYFTDNTFRTPDRRAMAGDTLFVGAFAPICNTSSQSIQGQARTILIRITSLLTGDDEVFTAIESLPQSETDSSNSGWFYIRPPLEPNYVPTAESRTAFVGNGILETLANDILTATLEECEGQRIAVQTRILIDPRGVVFDSRSNAPIAGATVTLIDVATGQPAIVFADDGVTPAPNTIITAADGRFRFPLVNAGSYRLQVLPPADYRFPSVVAIADLPPGRTIDPQGSYGGSFRVDADTGAVVLDVPLDPQRSGVLALEKSVEKSTASIGESLRYRLQLRNQSNQAIAELMIVDQPALGLRYVAKSARLDGKVLAEPEWRDGQWLFRLNAALNPGESLTLEYRMQVEAQALQGDGRNTAQAQGQFFSETIFSNRATAKVEISPGVFDDRAYLLGRVYLDCHQDDAEKQDADQWPWLSHPDDLGVPGVRLYLQDGSFVITDRHGQFSFYGLRPRTHVLKLDPITLPKDSEILLSSVRQALDPGSYFIDLKRGELMKANFALRCTDTLRAAVLARQKQASQDRELTVQLQKQLVQDDTNETADSRRGKAASGFVDNRTPAQFTPIVQEIPFVTGRNDSPPLEALLPTFSDNALAILDRKDGDILPSDTIQVRVKAMLGAEVSLFVNGVAVSSKQIGKIAKYPATQVQGIDFIAVKLNQGENILKVEQKDPFGNPRGTVTMRLIAPGAASVLRLRLPETEAVADGSTPVPITLLMEDANGTPVTARNFITLETSLGRFLSEDLDPSKPGVQVFIEGGRGEFFLLPPLAPGKATLRATDGSLNAEAILSFTPALRPLLMVGVIEGVIDLRKVKPRNFRLPRDADGFEEQLTGIFKAEDDELYRGGVRASLFLKGKVLGKYLLTAAYDSDKNAEDLFRDIDPNRYYPIYGDDSVKGFDAQSTGKLYVKLERGNSYVLLGDFQTGLANAGVELGRYQRNVSGAQVNIENANLQFRAFAARTDSRFVEEALPARGVSGPYLLSRRFASIVRNSEIVTLVTRSRDQNGLVLDEVPLQRLTDYVLDEFSGGLIFNQAIPSVDSNLNPIFIRVRYEVEGENERDIYGANLQMKIGERLEVGASYAKDNDDLEPVEILGANVQLKLDDKTRLIVEAAQSDTLQGQGDAYRLNLERKGGNANYSLRYSNIDERFNNPAGGANTPGREELAIQAEVQVRPGTTLKAEGLVSEAKQNRGQREGAYVGVQQNLGQDWQTEVGVRYSKASDIQTPRGTTVSDDYVSGRLLLRYRPRFMKNLSVFGDYEQAFNGDGQVFALGGDYALSARTRLYFRHEFINSLTGRYGLDSQEERNVSVFGLESEVLGSASVYSEYRVRDTIDGRSNQAALGLRNTWTLAQGLALETQLERVEILSGAQTSDIATSLALGLAYTRSDNWKATTRLEYRFSQQQKDWTYRFGIAAQLSDHWSFLGRNYYQLSDSDSDYRQRNRLQLGFAYRPLHTDRWNSLFRYEWKREDERAAALRRDVQMFSVHGHYSLQPRWSVYGRLAAKYVREDFADLSTSYDAYLLSARSTYDLNPRWQLGILGSVLNENSGRGVQYGLGGEIGVVVSKNLLLQVGYNVQGYDDKDFSEWEYTAKGPYLRLRYKFDEGLIRRPTAVPVAVAAAPAVVVPPPAAPMPLPETILLGSDVLFAFGQATLKPEGQAVLADLAAQWRDARLESVMVIGYTDRIGSSSANQRLSEARAASVKAELIRLGVNADLISSEGRGESQPTAATTSCSDRLAKAVLIQCLQPDRRVEIRVRGLKNPN
jgi:uncharacterized repeat protein (TIGR01451 family)